MSNGALTLCIADCRTNSYPTRCASIKSPAKTPAVKRLSYMELRDLEQMEAKIMAVEETLHAAQREMEDPKVLANRDRLREVCMKVDSAQKAVSAMYARWEALEARR